MFVLDTMAVSELWRSTANAGLRAWADENEYHGLFLAAPVIGELEFGITLLPKSKRRNQLEAQMQLILQRFERRILPLDAAAARAWGRAIGTARSRGRALPPTDAQIAAIAMVNEMTVVTRNERHFSAAYFPGLEVTNPWT